LGNLCGISYKTAEKYVDILERAYVVFRLPSYSANHRNELKKSRKIYFWDNGVRNAVISDFRPAALRNDIGALWENYLVSERLKANEYNFSYATPYFWRTSTQTEVDYIEECDGGLAAFEFKWGKNHSNTAPRAFASAYPGASFTVVDRSNYHMFLENFLLGSEEADK
jgi:predicted AAA+ superfamily ATPase